MRSKILHCGILFIMSFVFVLFISCTEQKAQEASTTSAGKKSLEEDNIALPNCCSASCPGASCIAYVSPCNCYCTITGLPNCSGDRPVDTVVEGDFEIIATSEQLAHQLAVISYLLNSTNPHAMEAHALAWNMYNLFAGNNGSITSAPALQNYLQNIRGLESILKKYFTPEEISQIQKAAIS